MTKINKTKPLADWDLDEKGKKELQNLLDSGIFSDVKKIFTSTQFKAKIAATKISQKYNLPLIETNLLTECDRSRVGFIEGDYVEVIKDYFTNPEFKYDWETIPQMKKRMKEFLNLIKDEEGPILAASHGTYMSILLHKYFDKDIVDFWKNLGFGVVIEVDYDKLKESLKF